MSQPKPYVWTVFHENGSSALEYREIGLRKGGLTTGSKGFRRARNASLHSIITPFFPEKAPVLGSMEVLSSIMLFAPSMDDAYKAVRTFAVCIVDPKTNAVVLSTFKITLFGEFRGRIVVDLNPWYDTLSPLDRKEDTTREITVRFHSGPFAVAVPFRVKWCGYDTPVKTVHARLHRQEARKQRLVLLAAQRKQYQQEKKQSVHVGGIPAISVSS